MAHLKEHALTALMTFFALAVLGFFASIGLVVLLFGSVGAVAAWIATASTTKRSGFDFQVKQ